MIDPATEAIQKRAAEVAGLLKTLSHPNRLLIACELMQGELSVSQIEAASGVRQPVLSRELARLREEKLVETRRESKVVFYRLKDARLIQLMEALCAVFGPNKNASSNTGVVSEGGPSTALAGEYPIIDGRKPKRVRLRPDPYRKV